MLELLNMTSTGNLPLSALFTIIVMIFFGVVVFGAIYLSEKYKK